MSAAAAHPDQVVPAWRPALVALGAVGLFALTYGPLLADFAGNLWSRPYYQHFPFVLLAAGILIYRHLSTALVEKGDWLATGSSQRPSNSRKPACLSPFSTFSTLLIFAAWAVLVLAAIALSPLLAAISAILLAGGLLDLACRRLNCAFPTGPWLLLWLVIPPPVGLDQRLLTRLQLISSDLASKALDLLGVGHLMEGNTLILPTKQLFVNEACSGIVSVVSLSACAAIYAVWRRRPLLPTALLMAAAVGWAVLLNVVRIAAIALAEVNTRVDLAEGPAHTLLGLSVFALNAVAIVLLDWLLVAFISPVGPRWTSVSNTPQQIGIRLTAAWDWLTTTNPSPPQGERLGEGASNTAEGAPRRRALRPSLSLAGGLMVAAFAAVGLAQAALPGRAILPQRAAELPTDQVVAALLEPGAMPERIGELSLVDVRHVEREREDINGEHSVIFEYQAGGQHYLASIDFPFARGWHDLSVCYRCIGWEVESRQVDADPERPTVRLDLRKRDQNAVVVFRACYADGTMLSPPSAWGAQQKVLKRINRRLQTIDADQYLQLQVLATSPAPADPSTTNPSTTNQALAILAEVTNRVAAALAPLVAPAEGSGTTPSLNPSPPRDALETTSSLNPSPLKGERLGEGVIKKTAEAVLEPSPAARPATRHDPRQHPA